MDAQKQHTKANKQPEIREVLLLSSNHVPWHLQQTTQAVYTVCAHVTVRQRSIRCHIAVHGWLPAPGVLNNRESTQKAARPNNY